MRKYVLDISIYFLLIYFFLIGTGYSEIKSETPAVFSNFRWGGFVEVKTSLDAKEDNKIEDLWEMRNKFRLKMTFDYNEKSNVHLSTEGKYTVRGRTVDQKKKNSDIDIYEGYISWYGNQFEWRIGKQIIFWGKTDEINPTDNLNPQDLYEYIIPDREDRKIPVFIAKLDYYVRNFIIEGVWIPFFKANEFAEEDSDWKPYQFTIPSTLQVNGDILPTRLKMRTTQKPSKQLKNSEWGIRISKTMDKFEWSFSYLDTWDDNPIPKRYLQLNQSCIDVIVEPEHKRQHIWGGDFNTYLKRMGIRSESAFFYKYFQTEDMNDEDGIIKKPYLSYVVGIDHTLFQNLDFTLLKDLYINCQFSQQMIFQYDKLIKEKKYRNLVILQLKNKYLSDTLEVDIRGGYSLNDKDYRINPNISYDITDAFNLNFGIEILGGKNITPFGQFDNNDLFYIKTKYSF